MRAGADHPPADLSVAKLLRPPGILQAPLVQDGDHVLPDLEGPQPVLTGES